MTDGQVLLLTCFCFTWLLVRTMILKHKPIPKWLDVSITFITVILTMYVVYDTFIK